MDTKHGRRARRFCARLVALAFAAIAPGICAQENLVSTTLSNNRLVVGETTSLTLTIRHEEPTDVAVELPLFPGLSVVDGPSIRPIALLQGAESIRVVEVRMALRAEQPGRFVLPSIPIQVAGQPHATLERLIEIGVRGDRDGVPFLIRWSVDAEEIVLGQGVPVFLEAYNATEYFFPTSLRVDIPAGAILEEVQGLGTVEQYSVDGQTLFRLPVAVYMLTPTLPGTIRLPAATVANGPTIATGPALSVSVRDAPDTVAATGAVGRFAYRARLDPAEVSLTGEVRLELTVVGEGNLHILQIPDPILDGFEVVSDERLEEIVPTSDGYAGEIVRVLRLRPTRAGTLPVLPRAFPFVPAGGGAVQTATIEQLTASVAAPDGLPARVALESTPLSVDQIRGLDRRVWFSELSSLGLIAPGLLILLALRLFRPRMASSIVILVASLLLIDAYSDRLPVDDLVFAERLATDGDLRGAVRATERIARHFSDSPGINYNLAVYYAQLGDLPRAVFAARETIRLAPGRSRPRDLLAEIEELARINRTIPPLHRFHPDLFVFSSAILANGLLVGIALVRRRRAILLLGGIVLVLLVVASALLLVSTSISYHSQLAVAVDDVVLTRIPGPDSDGWLPITGGTAVRIVASQGDAILVETSLGQQGWARLQDLIWQKSPLIELIRYRAYALEYL